MVSLILFENATASTYSGTEDLISQLMMWLKLGVETSGAIIIGIGAVNAVYLVIRAIVSRQTRAYYFIRLRLARFLALALEFQLAADIIGTAISPTWSQLGKLATIAVLRTALNYALGREMKEEEEECESIPVLKTGHVEAESSR